MPASTCTMTQNYPENRNLLAVSANSYASF